MPMSRKRATIMVSVEIDPIDGAFDELNVERDVYRILQAAVPHYNPVVLRLDSLHKYDKVAVVKHE